MGIQKNKEFTMEMGQVNRFLCEKGIGEFDIYS